MTGKKLKTAFNQVLDNDKRLALSILEAAKSEADQGDISALSFLIMDGQSLEELLLPKSQIDRNEKVESSPVLEFCRRTWEKVLKGEIVPKWADLEIMREYSQAGFSIPGLKFDSQEDDIFDSEN